MDRRQSQKQTNAFGRSMEEGVTVREVNMLLSEVLGVIAKNIESKINELIDEKLGTPS